MGSCDQSFVRRVASIALQHLGKRANPNLADPTYGMTPLMSALSNGHQDIVGMLVPLTEVWMFNDQGHDALSLAMLDHDGERAALIAPYLPRERVLQAIHKYPFDAYWSPIVAQWEARELHVTVMEMAMRDGQPGIAERVRL